MAENAIRVVLEVDRANGSLTGRARIADGTIRNFTGWLGLLTVLQALLPIPQPRAKEHEQL